MNSVLFVSRFLSSICFSEYALKIFLIFCMNSVDKMGKKMTYTGFFKNISIFLKPGNAFKCEVSQNFLKNFTIYFSHMIWGSLRNDSILYIFYLVIVNNLIIVTLILLLNDPFLAFFGGEDGVTWNYRENWRKKEQLQKIIYTKTVCINKNR